MVSVIIGISGGLILMLLFTLLKGFDKKFIYGLILSGIGFLYVGFTWTNIMELIICCAQAILFVFIAYFGATKNIYILAGGYFLHGSWDMIYHLSVDSSLIPPSYDTFCLSIDFAIGIYILAFKHHFVSKKVISAT